MICQCQNPACRKQLNLGSISPGLYSVTCPICRIDFDVTIPAHEPTCIASVADYVIYDLETTGLSPDREEIIQIAAVRFRNGRLLRSETFFSFARPSNYISSFITSLTGIRNSDVSNAPRPGEVLQLFTKFVNGARLIAHNGCRFDSRFLEATCHRHGLAHSSTESIDSLNLSRRLFGTTRGTGHGLDRVLSRLGISTTGHARHDARADVELLGTAVEMMWNKLGLDPFFTGIPTHPTCIPNLSVNLPGASNQAQPGTIAPHGRRRD